MVIFIDTSIFIDLLRKRQSVHQSTFSTVFLRVMKVLHLQLQWLNSVGAHLSIKPDAIEKTLEILSLVYVINLDDKITFRGGAIYSELVRSGLSIELNDCLIAATCLSVGIAEVVTRNVDHFDRICGIRAVTPEGLGF